MTKLAVELWADSFQEGNWACEQLSNFFDLNNVRYVNGFVPEFTFSLGNDVFIEITIFGSYKAWGNIPDKINELLEWGKPDFIFYHRPKDEIILAVEETAAVPTGNQALQRCERVYGSLRQEVPFWYLIGEYGVHKDGGIRRDSIWPTVMSLNLSMMKRTPCMVLHYSDIENPEDYSVGEGVDMLFKSISQYLEIHLGLKDKGVLISSLTQQFDHMLKFVNSQWNSIIDFLPGAKLLMKDGLAKILAEAVINEESTIPEEYQPLFRWPRTSDLPGDIYKDIEPGGIIKKDPLVLELEGLVRKKKAYNPSRGAGSRPQKKEELLDWIRQQKELYGATKSSKGFSIRIEDFPPSPSGNYHVTTAKNILYLIDQVNDVKSAYKKAFSVGVGFDGDDLPILFYISNSIKPGRIFGDPFTGQISAFANIFGRDINGVKTRIIIAYFPHQVHSQLIRSGEFNSNKGIKIIRELIDYAIFQGGVVVNVKNGELQGL